MMAVGQDQLINCKVENNTSQRRRITQPNEWKFLILAASCLATASSFQHAIPVHQQRQSSLQLSLPSSISKTALLASTIVPHPHNRNHHAELMNDYFISAGLAPSVALLNRKGLTQGDEDYEPKFELANERSACMPQWLEKLVPSVPSASSTSWDGAVSDLSSEELSYLKRKEEWAAKYTSVEALRETFGTNRNVIWGDLDAKTTRRLYKTLLPRALLELHCNAAPAHPEDLAPLAYQARVAAKLYARERCQLPARVAANLYDGWRQWKQYGKFSLEGMSYQQLWGKYAAVILEDLDKNQDDLTMEDVTAKICLKILERSCQTNAMVDNIVNYSEFDEEDRQDLKDITLQLEADAKQLLEPVEHKIEDGLDPILMSIPTMASTKATKQQQQQAKEVQLSVQQFKLLRSIVRIKHKLDKFQQLKDRKTQRRFR